MGLGHDRGRVFDRLDLFRAHAAEQQEAQQAKSEQAEQRQQPAWEARGFFNGGLHGMAGSVGSGLGSAGAVLSRFAGRIVSSTHGL